MVDLKTYGYTEIEAIPDGLLPGRVTELRRERFTVVTERGEVTAVLKGTFYHSAETRGMRELGLFDADEGISAGFTDVEKLFMQCRFTDCRHKTEPGCAVLAALADGSLSLERWERYVAQQYENKYVQDKTSCLIDKRARNKQIAMWSKQTKKKGGRKK